MLENIKITAQKILDIQNTFDPTQRKIANDDLFAYCYTIVDSTIDNYPKNWTK
jgi:hypothetical protein